MRSELKARSAECRQPTPANEQEIHDKAADLWKITGRKALVDIYDLHDNEFKQKVISYANNKYGKAR
jgi:hypothetical protein